LREQGITYQRAAARVSPEIEALGASSFFECHRIEILTVTPNLSFSNIPYMGVWNIGSFVRCAVDASKTAQRDDSGAVYKKL